MTTMMTMVVVTNCWRPLKRPTIGLRAAVWQQVKIRDFGHGLPLRLYTGSVCDDSAAEAASELDIDWIHPWIGLDWVG